MTSKGLHESFSKFSLFPCTHKNSTSLRILCPTKQSLLQCQLRRYYAAFKLCSLCTSDALHSPPPSSSIIQGLCKVIMLLNCLSKVKVLKCRSNNLPVRKTWQHFLKIWINPNFNFALLPWLQVTFSLQDQDSVKTDYILAWREQWEAMQIIHLIFEFE